MRDDAPPKDSHLVLVVDDHERLRRSVRRLLELEGYRVLEAGNAREALALAEREPPDLVLLDLEMPVADGWELLRAVQRGRPAVPVLLVSSSPELESAAQVPCVVAALRKPFEPTTLLQTVRHILS